MSSPNFDEEQITKFFLSALDSKEEGSSLKNSPESSEDESGRGSIFINEEASIPEAAKAIISHAAVKKNKLKKQQSVDIHSLPSQNRRGSLESAAIASGPALSVSDDETSSPKDPHVEPKLRSWRIRANSQHMPRAWANDPKLRGRSLSDFSEDDPALKLKLHSQSINNKAREIFLKEPVPAEAPVIQTTVEKKRENPLTGIFTRNSRNKRHDSVRLTHTRLKDKVFKNPEEEKEPTTKPSAMLEKDLNKNLKLDLILGMRTCILKAIEEDIHKQSSSLESDFAYSPEYTISRYGKSKKFRAKDFAPNAFMRLRELFGIEHTEYLISWSTSKWEEQCLVAKSRFVFTPDGKYVMKIITQEESKYLRSIMPQYFLHMTSAKNSFLMKILAHHKFTIAGKETWCIVACNILQSKMITEIYDLNGGISDKKKSPSIAKQPSPRSEDEYNFSFGPIMNDRQFTEKERGIRLPAEITTSLIANIAVDLKFLEQQNVTGYSLVLGVEQCPEEETNEENFKETPIVLSPTKRAVTGILKKPLERESELNLVSKDTSSPLSKVPKILYFCERATTSRIDASSPKLFNENLRKFSTTAKPPSFRTVAQTSPNGSFNNSISDINNNSSASINTTNSATSNNSLTSINSLSSVSINNLSSASINTTNSATSTNTNSTQNTNPDSPTSIRTEINANASADTKNDTGNNFVNNAGINNSASNNSINNSMSNNNINNSMSNNSINNSMSNNNINNSMSNNNINNSSSSASLHAPEARILGPEGYISSHQKYHERYYIGIVDFLNEFTTQKRLSTFTRVQVKGLLSSPLAAPKGPKGLSINTPNTPQNYSVRFMNMLQRIVIPTDSEDSKKG